MKRWWRVAFKVHLSVTMKRLTRYKQKVVLAAMLEGKKYALQNRLRAVSLFFLVRRANRPRHPSTSNMAANTNHTSLEKSTCHKISLLNMLPLKFPLQDNFLCALSIFVINRIPSHFLKEALVTWPLSASGLFASTTSDQTNYPDLDSDLSSLWNYYNRFSDVCQGQTSWDVTVSP